MNCPKCDAPVTESAKFCPVCGEAISPTAGSADSSAHLCATCGADLEPGVKFCPVCGALASAAQPKPAETAPPVPSQAPPVQPGSASVAGAVTGETVRDFGLPSSTSQPPAANYTPTYNNAPAAPPPKKKTGKIIAIVVAAVLVVSAGAGFFIAKTFFNRDLMQMMQSKQDYMISLDKSALLDAKNKLFAGFENGTGRPLGETVKIALGVDPTPYGSFFTDEEKALLQSLNDLTLSVDADAAKKDGGLDLALAMSIASKDGSAKVAATLLEKLLYIDLQDLGGDLLKINGAGEQVQQAFNSMMPAFAANFEVKSLNKASDKAIDSFFNALSGCDVTIEKNAKITVAGRSVELDKATMSITQKDLMTALAAFAKAYGDDSAACAEIAEIYNSLTANNPYADKITGDQIAESIKSSGDSLSSQAENASSNEPIKYFILVERDNSVVGRGIISPDGQDSYGYVACPASSEFLLSVYNDNDGNLVEYVSGVLTRSGDVLSGTINAVIPGAPDTLSVKLDNYTLKDYMSVPVPTGRISVSLEDIFNLSGISAPSNPVLLPDELALTMDVSGKTATFAVSGVKSGTDVLKLTLSDTVRDAAAVKAPAGDPVELDDFSEVPEHLGTLLTDPQSLLDRLMPNFDTEAATGLVEKIGEQVESDLG